MVGVILFTATVIASLTFFHFRETTKVYHENRLARKEKTILETVDYAITAYPEIVNSDNIDRVLEDRIFEYSDINDIHINLYSLTGKLLLSSEAKISIGQRRVPTSVLSELNQKNDRVEIRKYESDNLTYLTTYSYIYNINREPIGIISLPYIHDDSFLREELLDLLETFVGVILFVLVVGAVISWLLSRSITSRLQAIADRLVETQMVKSNHPIQYKYKDEVKVLVDSYNEMVKTINRQSEELMRIEREETWREMAKQVAHELKNPLTPMRLLIQSFQMRFDPSSPDIREKVNDLSEALINQIDTLTSIAEAFSDYAKMPVRKDEQMDVIDEIKKTIEVFSSTHIEFTTNVQSCVLSFDKVYISRIITNLIKNSIQAMPKDQKPKIHVDINKTNENVAITVTDNGPGIPEELIARIFEPKFTTKSSGSGLGLPMVKKIVEEYQGCIEYQTNPTGGAIFIINLPLIQT